MVVDVSDLSAGLRRSASKLYQSQTLDALGALRPRPSCVMFMGAIAWQIDAGELEHVRESSVMRFGLDPPYMQDSTTACPCLCRPEVAGGGSMRPTRVFQLG